MYPTDTMESDEQQGRLSMWRLTRWVIAVAASLVFVTVFLAQAASTEAAAPTPSDDMVYHAMAATTPLCQQGYNCLIQNCLSGNYNFCSYNLNAGYPYNFGYGCGLAFVGCGVNAAIPTYVAPAVFNFPAYTGVANGFFGFPNYLGANTVCNNGNFACYRANFPFFGAFPWFGTGVFNGGAAVIAANTTPIVVGAPYRVKEVAPPVAATAPAAQPAAPVAVVQTAPVAAPAAPAANYATALNAPTQTAAPAAPAASGPSVKIYSAPSATTPSVAADPDDHRG